MLLELVDVAKQCRGVRAVDGVTMRLGPRLTGLLGPNGSQRRPRTSGNATARVPVTGGRRYHVLVGSGTGNAVPELAATGRAAACRFGQWRCDSASRFMAAC